MWKQGIRVHWYSSLSPMPITHVHNLMLLYHQNILYQLATFTMQSTVINLHKQWNDIKSLIPSKHQSGRNLIIRLVLPLSPPLWENRKGPSTSTSTSTPRHISNSHSKPLGETARYEQKRHKWSKHNNEKCKKSKEYAKHTIEGDTNKTHNGNEGLTNKKGRNFNEC